MKKWFLLFLIILCMVPLVNAVKECKGVMPSRQIPCMIITAYDYPEPCSTYQIKIYNETPLLIQTLNLSDYGITGRCNATFNITTKGSYILNTTSGDTASIIIEEEDNMELAIIITLSVMILLGMFLIYFLDNFMKLVAFLGTLLIIPFLMNILANLAVDFAVSSTIVGLLWLGYRISLILFWVAFLYVLVKLTMELRIKKNPMPSMGSPLEQAKRNRKETGRYGNSY